jgi:hypothetical protein
MRLSFVVAMVLCSCVREEPGLGRAEGALANDCAEIPFELPADAVVVDPPPGLDWAIQIPVTPAGDAESQVLDEDGDGFEADDDPDDADAEVHPILREQPCNGRDEDGDGLDQCPPDVDGDGAHGGVDCDDLDPDVGPLARETRCDGLDQNCDGHDLCDRDRDGVVDWDDAAPGDPSAGGRPEVREDTLE